MLSQITEKRQTENIPVFYFSPGISYRNAPVVKPVTLVRNYPWLMMRWQTPMTVVRQGTPHNEMEKEKILNTRRPYWRRKVKDNVVVRLTHGGKEVANFEEMGLGQTPGSENVLPTHERNPFTQTLDSLLKKAGTVWQQFEEEKTIREAARTMVREHDRAKQEGLITSPNFMKGVTAITAVGLMFYIWR